MTEVEIKLPVETLNQLAVQLTDMGFILEQIVEEKDRYFDNEKQEIRGNDQALRLRQVLELESQSLVCRAKHAQITFKGKKQDTVSMTREELETDIGDADTAEKILNALGYHAVAPEVTKRRAEYIRGVFHACLDRVENLGDYLELEIVTEDADKEQALEQIWELLGQLGYSKADTVTTSYLSMLQRLF